MPWHVCFFLLDFQHAPVFLMRITAGVTKSLHQDHHPCYLHLPIFFLHIQFCWKRKSYCDGCFPQQHRLQTIVQLYILQDDSSVRIGFDMINATHCLQYTPC